MTATNWDSMKIGIDCAPGNSPRVSVVMVCVEDNSDRFEIFITQEPMRATCWYCEQCRVSHKIGEECPRLNLWRSVPVTAGFLYDLELENRKMPATECGNIKAVADRLLK